MKNELDKKDYYAKYYKRGFGKFTDNTCIICGYDYKVPESLKNNLTTCCDYCKKVKLTKQKLVGCYIQCKVCGKVFWKQPSKNRKYCGKNCADLATSIYAHERNLIKVPDAKKYYGSNWYIQRNEARKRDNYSCQICGISETNYGMQLSVHHKKPFLLFENYIEANNLKNLICLCEPCHRKVHTGKNHPQNYLRR